MAFYLFWKLEVLAFISYDLETVMNNVIWKVPLLNNFCLQYWHMVYTFCTKRKVSQNCQLFKRILNIKILQFSQHFSSHSRYLVVTRSQISANVFRENSNICQARNFDWKRVILINEYSMYFNNFNQCTSLALFSVFFWFYLFFCHNGWHSCTFSTIVIFCQTIFQTVIFLHLIHILISEKKSS